MHLEPLVGAEEWLCWLCRMYEEQQRAAGVPQDDVSRGFGAKHWERPGSDLHPWTPLVEAGALLQHGMGAIPYPALNHHTHGVCRAHSHTLFHVCAGAAQALGDRGPRHHARRAAGRLPRGVLLPVPRAQRRVQAHHRRQELVPRGECNRIQIAYCVRLPMRLIAIPCIQSWIAWYHIGTISDS